MATNYGNTKPKSIKGRIIAIVIVVVLLVGGYFVYKQVTQALLEQGAVSLRTAIIDASKQCCAIEGAYPSSLEYLEENYGLSINSKDYIVTYEVYAENVAPTVVVLPR